MPFSYKPGQLPEFLQPYDRSVTDGPVERALGALRNAVGTLSGEGDPSVLLGDPMGFGMATRAAKAGVPKAVEIFSRMIEKGPEPVDAAKIFLGDLMRGGHYTPEMPPIRVPKVVSPQAGRLEIPFEAGARNRSPIQAEARATEQHYLSTAGAKHPPGRPPQADRRLLGMGSRGKRAAAKLNEDQVLQARQLYNMGEDTDYIAKQFGVQPGTIESLLRGDSWTRVK